VHQDGVVPQHGELLGRDLGKRVAEPLGVVEPDGRQDRRSRGNDVGGVEPAAEARLDHPDLHPGRRECVERGGGEQLELRHGPLLPRAAIGDLRRLLGALERLVERLFGDSLPPDHDALSPGVDVRREVGA
jgi:hypothetical protein